VHSVYAGWAAVREPLGSHVGFRERKRLCKIQFLITTALVLCKPINDPIAVDVSATTAIIISTISGLGVAVAALIICKPVKYLVFVDVSAATAIVITAIDCIRLTLEATSFISFLIEGPVFIVVNVTHAILIKAIA